MRTAPLSTESRTAPSDKTRRRATLPPSKPGSTIAEAGLNFRVRDGIGCGPRSMDGGKTCSPGDRPRLATERDLRGLIVLCSVSAFAEHELTFTVQVKPHDRLVPVSSAPYGASTPGLSTSWSRRGL